MRQINPDVERISCHSVSKSKVIGLVVVTIVIITKINGSRVLGVLESGLCCHDAKNGEKLINACFKALDKDHEC